MQLLPLSYYISFFFVIRNNGILSSVSTPFSRQAVIMSSAFEGLPAELTFEVVKYLQGHDQLSLKVRVHPGITHLRSQLQFSSRVLELVVVPVEY